MVFRIQIQDSSTCFLVTFLLDPSSFVTCVSQSCSTAVMMTKVLSSACADTSVSQLSALLSLHRNLLLTQEERPSSMLKGAKDSLCSLSKVRYHPCMRVSVRACVCIEEGWLHII